MLTTFDPKTSFFFGSGAQTLVTEGTFARISTPADGGYGADSRLQREIAAQLRAAKVAGIDRPVVVGSIPFDTTRPSCLFVPRSYQWISDSGEGALATLESSSLPPGRTSSTAPIDAGREIFQSAVSSILEMCRTGTLQKVVLSRTLDVDFDDDVDARAVLRQLLHANPSGYRFSVPLGGGETLLGASPELLVRRIGDRITSNPLAGSISKCRVATEREAIQYFQDSDKDRLEHRLVAEQVRSVLAAYCRDIDSTPEPTILETAALWHLSTVFEAVLSEPAANALALACALHPTPAVCGFPSQLAMSAIARMEPFQRGLFTGMTGWMDGDGDGEWAVTIRCGIVKQRSVRLFAGAGIVQGSVPEQEWAETGAKMTPLLRAVGCLPSGGA